MPTDHCDSKTGNAIYSDLLKHPTKITGVFLVEALSGKVYPEIDLGEEKNIRLAHGLTAVERWIEIKSVWKNTSLPEHLLTDLGQKIPPNLMLTLRFKK